jgi:anti-anti-sigma factor
MRKHFKDLFDRESYRIVLDMTELNYISCAAVIALLGASDTAHENAGNVILANANEAIRSTLDSLGVTPLLTFAATREEAARRLA